MSIIGIGTDIIEIARLKKILKKDSKAFLKHIATEKEYQWVMGEVFKATENKSLNFNRFCEFWAGRFAAKEALAKALGVGIGKDFSFLSTSIFYDKIGKPYFEINKNFKTPILKKLGVKKIHLSISHTATLAIAFVTLER